ncbi:MAG: hypothetical protein KJ995_02860 [Candidatus Omnitrophica bacterium]|nr:hypothetical protein [Candidatus Omnitrophota bacterium]MBU1127797.1 hypothetical protein [Candidatus Omnitrophota bacterium]MBU1784658.1 hypothetical protein [Candidatus Omnitrophota bacterium]MBU1851328.1 hypothetical protein [Candidatus Omnitrophota bacterium]
MKFIDFKNVLSQNEVIDIQNVKNLFDTIDRRRLYEWQKKGYIKKLTNNFYIFSDTEINDSFLKMTGNKIYSPSYVGLESALSYYGLIPEAVFQVTGISSRKTRNINTVISNFSYRSIHKRHFWGYTLITDTSHNFLISDPEKTILDYLYLNPDLNNTGSLKELRLNYGVLKGLLNIPRLEKYLQIFSHTRLSKSLNKLMRLANAEF